MSYDDLLQLHANCIMVLNIAPSTLRTAAACDNKELDPALYGKLVKYRLKLQDRVEYLESDTLQHELPSSENGDLCMPALLKNWSEKKKNETECRQL